MPLLLSLWMTPACTSAPPPAGGLALVDACGRDEGDKVCDLQLLGYADGDARAPFRADLRLVTLIDQAPTPKILLLLGGAWCPSCRQATTELVERHGEVAPWATVINVLVEGDTPKEPARKSHVDAWRELHSTPFSVLADAFKTPLAARDQLGFRESAMIVDRATLEVEVRRGTLAALWPTIEQRAAEVP